MNGSDVAADGLCCPLCTSQRPHYEKAIPIAALRTYWQQFGYDLDSDFPALPEALSEYRCLTCGLHWFAPALIGPPALYEKLENWTPYYRANAWEWDIAIDILKQHEVKDVLEIGAGTGAFLERAAAAIPRCEGLEFNPAALAKARACDLKVTDRALSSVEADRSAIVAFQLLEHLEDPGLFLTTCAAKLRPGGLLIVAVPNQDGFMGGLDTNFLNCPPHHATLWRHSCFKISASRIGLDFIDYRTAPLALAQYKIFLLRHARPRATLAGKLLNFLHRLSVNIMAPIALPFARRTIAGEAHMAVFRKPAS